MLTRAISYLIASTEHSGSDRFYADLLMQMDRVATTRIPTAGVRVTNSRIELSYNPQWFSSLDISMQVFVLKHECLHIIADHIERVKQYGADAITHQFYNMCMDLAVNSLIPNFPNSLTIDGKEMEFCTVPNFRRQYNTLRDSMPFDYYVNYFKQEEQDHKALSDKIKNMQFDDHSGMYDKDGVPSEVKQQVVKHAVNEALKAAQRAGTNPPDGVRQLIRKLFKDRGDWKRALRQFPDDAEVCSIESSRKIRNRRYGTVFPGDKKIRRKRIGVGFDVSGSISNEVAASLMTECDKIIASGCELYVMFFGTAVVREETWTKTPDLRTYNVPDGGGTLFAPVFDRARALKLDGLIMLTDGYNFDGDIAKPSYPTLWGIIGNDNYKAAFGKVIYIHEDDKDEKAA